MDPNQQPQTQPENSPSLNYLDQIAAESSRSSWFSSPKKLWTAVGLGLVLLLSLLIIIVGTINNNSRPTERLGAYLLAAQAVASDSSSKVKSSELRGINGNLNIYLTNTVRDIESHLSKQGVNIKNLGQKANNEINQQAILDKLEDDRLNGVYDRAYSKEMTYMLDMILALMQQISSGAANSELKDFLSSSYDSLIPIHQQFADFNEAAN